MQTFIDNYESISDLRSADNALEPYPFAELFELRDRDIVCGRGKGCWNHPGNQMFQTIIHASVERYSGSKSKNEKSLVVASIVEGLCNSGSRFVKEDKKTGGWYDIGQTQARDKTGHAIRDYMMNRSKREARATLRIKKQSIKGKGTKVPKHKNESLPTIKPSTVKLMPYFCPSYERLPKLFLSSKKQPFDSLSVPPIPLNPRFSNGQRQQGLEIFDVVDLLVNQAGSVVSGLQPVSSHDLSAQEVLELYELLSEEEADMAWENDSDDIDADLPFSDDWWWSDMKHHSFWQFIRQLFLPYSNKPLSLNF